MQNPTKSCKILRSCFLADLSLRETGKRPLFVQLQRRVNYTGRFAFCMIMFTAKSSTGNSKALRENSNCRRKWPFYESLFKETGQQTGAHDCCQHKPALTIAASTNRRSRLPPAQTNDKYLTKKYRL